MDAILLPSGNMLVPKRAESDSLLGDGAEEVSRGSPEFSAWVDYYTRLGREIPRTVSAGRSRPDVPLAVDPRSRQSGQPPQRSSTTPSTTAPTTPLTPPTTSPAPRLQPQSSQSTSSETREHTLPRSIQPGAREAPESPGEGWVHVGTGPRGGRYWMFHAEATQEGHIPTTEPKQPQATPIAPQSPTPKMAPLTDRQRKMGDLEKRLLVTTTEEEEEAIQKEDALVHATPLQSPSSKKAAEETISTAQPKPPPGLPPDRKGALQIKHLLKLAETFEAEIKEGNDLIRKASAMFWDIKNTGRDHTPEELDQVYTLNKSGAAKKIAAAEKKRQSIKAVLKIPIAKSTIMAVNTSTLPTDSPLHEEVNKATIFLDSIISQQAAGDKYFKPSVVIIPKQLKDQRASYINGFCKMSERDDASVIAHEMGHHLESNPAVRAAANRFLDRRLAAAGTQDVSLSETLVGYGYGKSEIGNKDHFDQLWDDPENPGYAYYAGKRYKASGETEIISMGLEQLYIDPVAFARKDPDYFSFITSVLDGRGLTSGR